MLTTSNDLLNGELNNMLEVLKSEGTTKKGLLAHAEKPYTSAGITFQKAEGSKSLNVKQDDIVVALEKELKDRKAVLKAAAESSGTIYDAQGIEVPNVGYSYGKDYVTVKY